MIYSVADRFKFRPADFWDMKLSELRYWYDGVCKLYEEEQKKVNG